MIGPEGIEKWLARMRSLNCSKARIGNDILLSLAPRFMEAGGWTDGCEAVVRDKQFRTVLFSYLKGGRYNGTKRVKVGRSYMPIPNHETRLRISALQSMQETIIDLF